MECCMCDYSLQTVQSRTAKVGDKLITRNFGTGTKGFAAPENPSVAVCVLPGTELVFSKEMAIPEVGFFGLTRRTTLYRTAIFRQINKNMPHTHHDALEFSDGQIVLLTSLCEGQEATVLQLPAQPTTPAEVEEQKRAEFVG
jgi:hypothetical protein